MDLCLCLFVQLLQVFSYLLFFLYPIVNQALGNTILPCKQKNVFLLLGLKFLVTLDDMFLENTGVLVSKLSFPSHLHLCCQKICSLNKKKITTVRNKFLCCIIQQKHKTYSKNKGNE